MSSELKPGDRVRFTTSTSLVGVVTGLLRCGNKDCVEIRVDRVDGSGQYDLYTVDPAAVSKI